MQINLDIDERGTWGGVFLDGAKNICEISEYTAVLDKRGPLLWFGRVSKNDNDVHACLLSQDLVRKLAIFLKGLGPYTAYGIYSFLDKKRRRPDACQLIIGEDNKAGAVLKNITQDTVMVITAEMCPTLIRVLDGFADKARLGP